MAGNSRVDRRKRALAVAALFALGFIGVALRLVWLQVIDQSELEKKARLRQEQVVELHATRGTIYDSMGRELAVSIESNSLYGVPKKVDNPGRLAARLAPVLGISQGGLKKKLAGKKSFVWLARKVAPDVPDRVEKVGDFTGMIGWLPDSRRYYPKKELAGHVLGFTGTDNEGLEGLEAGYEGLIGGSPGRVVTERDGAGRKVLSLEDGYLPPQSGNDIILTLDEKVQYIAEKELDRVMEEYSPVSATAIVMDPMTGAILAMANRPGFNPNRWQAFPEQSWRNKAVTDLYEPGSTFKVVAAAAALEEGVFRPSDSIYCGEGKITVGGRTIHDAHKEKGYLSFAEVIQKSSNVGTVKVALELGPARLYRYASAFGFGEKTGVDLFGETKGVLRNVKDWSGVSIASVAIGQEVSVTPLQMLCAVNCIANGGYLLKPYIVSEIRDHDGGLMKQAEPEIVRRVVSEATARKLSEILCSVVEDGGTAIQAGVRGYKVAGKTGTAQKYDPEIRRYSRKKYVSSFAGYVPAEDPRISVIVVVNEPRGEIYGGLVAAPAFKRIVEQTLTYLKVPTRLPEQTLLVER